MERKTLRIIYWVTTILFVAFMLFSGVSELLQLPSAQKALTDLGYPIYLNYILGIAKILGGIALLQWKWNALKEWAYAGFTIDLLGAAASIGFVTGSAMMIFPLLFFIPLFISYWSWKRTRSSAAIR